MASTVVAGPRRSVRRWSRSSRLCRTGIRPDGTSHLSAPDCVYDLDADHRIVAVSGSWSAFALENGAPELVAPAPLGRSVFTYVADATTTHLYRAVFEAVARSGLPVVLPIRCDAPALRRFLELRVERPPGRTGVRVRSALVRTEARDPVPLLDRTRSRSDQLLRMCSWCKVVEVDGRWCSVEEAVAALRLFERAHLPAITHTMCPACYARMHALVAKLEAGRERGGRGSEDG